MERERGQPERVEHRPGLDVHVLHPPVGHHRQRAEEDAAAHQQVVLALGVADGAEEADVRALVRGEDELGEAQVRDGAYLGEAFERGEGAYVYADDGRRFLDFGAGIATTMAVGVNSSPHEPSGPERDSSK